MGWVLGYTIAAEIGDIARFASLTKLAGYTGLCPRILQSGGKDHRGPLAKNGPKYLRWALIEAAVHAARHPIYVDRYRHTKTRLGRRAAQRSPKWIWPAGCRGDLAHVHHQPPLRSGRRCEVSGLVEGPKLRCATGAKPLPAHLLLPSRRR
ncbi:MAG TPA: IS110 family transposase [Dehalococcoidia bacterium]|nr:IS110 family transposase [Dehalococcoidia bacterium]